MANKLNQVLGIKKDILEGKSKKDIHAIYPLFDSEEIEVLEDYILEQDCTEIDLVKKLLELKLYIWKQSKAYFKNILAQHKHLYLILY